MFVGKNVVIYAVLSDLEENYSISVTNAVECIRQQLKDAEKIPPSAEIIEHYSGRFHGNTFDMVTFDAYGNPEWKPLSSAAVFQLLECDKSEFSNSKKNKRVQKEIYDAVNGIPPIEKFEYTEDPEISERRLSILLNQFSKQEVKDKLNTYPGETAMAEFLKKDMSLLAECYAYPNEGYVCFSEFPVGSGRVDFAVFTGTSRMTVYLIEIKNAQQNLCRKNHYKEFRSYVQEGRGQLLQRASYIDTNYEKYRRFVHSVLKEVKNGKRPYNAFLGPNYRLEVDPNKDVKFRYILIAGRTENDLADSHKRHVEDYSSVLDIQTETWDSWCNKLTRE